jgi:hypothetical protein
MNKVVLVSGGSTFEKGYPQKQTSSKMTNVYFSSTGKTAHNENSVVHH